MGAVRTFVTSYRSKLRTAAGASGTNGGRSCTLSELFTHSPVRIYSPSFLQCNYPEHFIRSRRKHACQVFIPFSLTAHPPRIRILTRLFVNYFVFASFPERSRSKFKTHAVQFSATPVFPVQRGFAGESFTMSARCSRPVRGLINLRGSRGIQIRKDDLDRRGAQAE